jgi:putative ABC transport system permease protein
MPTAPPALHAFRQAARALARHPGPNVLVVLIVSLCIGGIGATFSAARAILFKPLPYPSARRMVVLQLVNPEGGDDELSYAEIEDWRRRSTLLEDMTPYFDWHDRVLSQGDGAERIAVTYCSPRFLDLLGARPALGRLFSPDEDRARGGAPVLVLSHELWSRSFARDPRIVGKQVRLNDRPYTVIGVMARSFVDFAQNHTTQAWLPAVQAPEAFPAREASFLTGRDERDWDALALLKPGVNLERAQAEVDAIASQLRREFPASNRGYGARLIPLRRQLFGDLYPGMKVLLVGAIFVLLSGCANVANLLLVRMAERQRELSLRLALGAGLQRLVRHVLAESLVLAAVGGALGLLLAVWGAKLLAALVVLPPLVDAKLDPMLLSFVALATLLTGFLFGLPPAISVARMDSRGTLQQIRAVAGGRTHSARTGGTLLVFQIAVVSVLLVMSGLLLRSFLQLRGTGVGIKTGNLLTLRLRFAADLYRDRAKLASTEEELLRRAAALPGVEGAAFWGPGIPAISTFFSEVKREGAAPSEPSTRADYHVITPGAVKLLGIPLVRGRELTPQDAVGAPRVSLITQALAEALWPGQDPIGKRMHMTDRVDPWSTVVGVIRNTRFEGRLWEGKNDILFCHAQQLRQDTNFLVRTRVDAASLATTVRHVVKQIDAAIPVYDVRTLDERLRFQERTHRLNAVVTGVFSALALTLALCGLYGVLAYSVVRRTPEIGLRMALGAEKKQILRMVVARGALLVGIGLLVGLAGAVALTRLISGVLYGVKPIDPWTFAGVVLAFAGVAAAATVLPARRALSIEPTIALRLD